MPTKSFQREVAQKVILRCAERGIVTFNPSVCESMARSFFGKRVVWGAGGVQWRAVRRLIGHGFEKKVARARGEIRKTPSAPPPEPEEMQIGSVVVTKDMVTDAKDHEQELIKGIPEDDL